MYPDVLERLREECDLTPNYFRLRFREVMACSPGEYVKRLRLRQARYLLYATDWQHKRIGAAVGYGDALCFSRLYREFWGRTPTAERKAQRQGYAPAPGVGRGLSPRADSRVWENDRSCCGLDGYFYHLISSTGVNGELHLSIIGGIYLLWMQVKGPG